MKADYIIVGQGLCGSLLSWLLHREGKSVVVVDVFNPCSPGRVACGLINPVTGMRIAKSWLIDELLPVAMQLYKAFEAEYNVTVFTQYDILEFHPSAAARTTFEERIVQYPDYLKLHNDETKPEQWFNYHSGLGIVTQGGLVDMRLLQAKWQEELLKNKSLLAEQFDCNYCTIQPQKVQYKDIEAEKIIFCDGAAGQGNPYFSLLPFALTKGEVFIADIPDLPRNYIYKQGIKIAPWQDNLFWIGASFEWKYDNVEPTETYRKKVESQLSSWLKLPVNIIHHWASERPATVDHKPFSGFHPQHPSVGILNGMGAKGCSQAPFFALNLMRHLVFDEPIHREVDVCRYTKILSR